MKMCYVDESGDTGPFDPGERNSQPIFLLCALMLDQGDLESLTREIIQLKQVHFPSYGQGVAHWHDWLKVEVKGANLRRALREGHRDSRRHMMGFLDQILSLLERHGIRLAARVYVKQPNVEFKGASLAGSMSLEVRTFASTRFSSSAIRLRKRNPIGATAHRIISLALSRFSLVLRNSPTP